ncbi:MAG: hypothetical protein IJ564_02570 [Alphaproteobacteria bacterium]|nr:hypothetical protein [Alphaproteobacteria bacterium]
MAKLSRQDIMERFEEAVIIAKRLPSVKPAGYKTAWPDIIYTEIEILQQDKKTIRLLPTPEQLTRLDEVLDWIVVLTEVERKLIWLRANHEPWRDVCFKLGMCRSAANEKLNSALDYLSEVIGEYKSST